MGNSCCLTHIGNNIDKNIYIDIDSYNRRKNELNTRKSNSTTLNNYERYKSEDNCSILINSFNKDINYIVKYKESIERKKYMQKFK